MNNLDSITIHDKGASIYDSQVKEYKNHMHEILFGMCYDYIEKDDLLLDIGIGTGMSSEYFANEGLQIYGMDGSSEMLKECKKKNFVKELKLHSITDIPLPYNNHSFRHIICCGVFHFIGEINSITKDVSRIINDGGFYAFTVITELAKNIGSKSSNFIGCVEMPGDWGIPIYKHSDSYINKISNSNGFDIVKEQQILAFSGYENIGDIVFKLYIMQKEEQI